MRSNPFGRHLSSQIIWPLVLASTVIGIVATLVAVRIIGDIVGTWTEEQARATAGVLINDVVDRHRSETRALTLLSKRPGFLAVIAGGDEDALGQQLRIANESIDADSMVVLDADGSVVSSWGPLDVASAAPALPVGDGAYTTSADPDIVRVGDAYALWTVVPIAAEGRDGLSLGSLITIDDAFLSDLDVGTGAAAAVVDGDGSVIGSVRLSDAVRATEPSAEVRDAFQVAIRALIADPGTTVPFVGKSGDYRVASRPIKLADGSGASIFAIAVIDASAAESASGTTVRLIGVWSLIAVALLVALNWWVARSVTTPVHALTTSTRRLAEGDFSAKVPVAGSSELSELAENFNSMTDSLKERSDSLTKKVLELATLYEMSRSLGLTLDLDDLLDSVLESALRIFDVEIGYVAMIDRESGTLRLRVWRGVDLATADEGVVCNSMSEWVIREGRPLIFNPAGVDGDGRSEDGLSAAVAALCVPLQTAEGTIGSMTVGTQDANRRFTSDDVRLLATIANHVTIAIGNIALFSNVQEAYLATVRALAAAVDAKDPYTRGHSDGVAAYALRIGHQLDLTFEQMTALEMAAYLHDIGKIGISEDILLKPGKLTDAEMGQMRHHPLIGANILKPVAFPWPIAPIVRHHHEHFDGHGYPAGLRTDEIPVLARVLTVADAFEAMVADRPYRRGRSQQEAVLELQRCAGTQFDPRIVEAFIEALDADDALVPARDDALANLGPDEAQAVFIAICDGMFANFRRLGGPRLANNLERAVNEDLASADVPLSIDAGRLVASGDVDLDDDEYVAHLRAALGMITARIQQASGVGLADNFLSEAIETLPERMRLHAERLGFSPTI